MKVEELLWQLQLAFARDYGVDQAVKAITLDAEALHRFKKDKDLLMDRRIGAATMARSGVEESFFGIRLEAERPSPYYLGVDLGDISAAAFYYWPELTKPKEKKMEKVIDIVFENLGYRITREREYSTHRYILYESKVDGFGNSYWTQVEERQVRRSSFTSDYPVNLLDLLLGTLEKIK